MPSYVRGRRFRRISDEQIVKLYVEDGLDAETIGLRAACSGTTVLRIVTSAGHATRVKGRGKPRPLALTSAEIVERYRSGQSGPTIADAAGCTSGTIYKILRAHGQPVRVSASRQYRPAPPKAPDDG